MARWSTTPFRSEKNTNWEGAYRVPALIRWPGVVQPHTEINEIFSAEDWVATLVTAAGEPDIKSKLLQGYDAGGKTFKVHLDGYDQRDLLSGKGPDERREFFYWTDDGDLAGLRYDQYKHGTTSAWPGSLDAAARAAAGAQAVQSAFRPIRTRAIRIGRLREMVRRARVCLCSGAVDRGAAPRIVPGVPAAAAAGQLQRATGHGEAQESAVDQLGGRRFI